jgi:hypothetical protein
MNNVLFDSRNGDTTTIDGMVIGGTTTAAGSFTTLAASSVAATGAVTGASVAATGAVTGTATITAAGVPLGSGNTRAAGLTSGPTTITARMTNVTTADATHIAVILPTGVAGDERLVYNSGGASAQTITIYCQGTDTIDGGSAGGTVTLTVAHRGAKFFCVATNTWISSLIGAVST